MSGAGPVPELRPGLPRGANPAESDGSEGRRAVEAGEAIRLTAAPRPVTLYS
jgi:hypothetical protein